MNELALFAGAGGGILGGHLLGWRTVCAVEYNAYARSVLLARQNDGTLAPFPIWDDVRTFDGRPWRGIVDVVSGGFPCQDVSAAGRGDGLDGERSGLWSEMARIIGEVRPRYAFVENSPMLTSRGLGRVLGDLATLGFDAEWGVVSAADVGAPHLRERIWIVANARGGRCGRSDEGEMEQPRRAEAERGSETLSDAMCGGHWEFLQPVCKPECGKEADPRRDGKAQPMADAMRERVQRIIAGCTHSQERQGSIERQNRPPGYGFGRWPTEPGMGGTFDGLAVGLYRSDPTSEGGI